MSDRLVTLVARSKHPALEPYYVRDVLEAFAMRVNAKSEKESGDRRVWADYRTIAADCERAESAVREAVKILIAAGLLDDTGEREGRTARIKVFRVIPGGLEGHHRRRAWRNENPPEGLADSSPKNDAGGRPAQINPPEGLAHSNPPEGLARNPPEGLARNPPEGLENPHTPYKDEPEKEPEKEQEIPENGTLAPGRIRGPGSPQMGEKSANGFSRPVILAAAKLEADWLADMAALGRDVAASTRRSVSATLPEVIGGKSLRGWLKRRHVLEGDAAIAPAAVAGAIWDAWCQIRLSPEHVAGGWGFPWLLTRPVKTTEWALAWRERVAREAQPNHRAAVAIVAWWSEERQRRGLVEDPTAPEGVRAINGLLANVATDAQRDTSVAWIKRRLGAALDDGDAAIGALCRSRERLAAVRPKKARSTDGIGENMPSWQPGPQSTAAPATGVDESWSWEAGQCDVI